MKKFLVIAVLLLSAQFAANAQASKDLNPTPPPETSEFVAEIYLNLDLMPRPIPEDILTDGNPTKSFPAWCTIVLGEDVQITSWEIITSKGIVINFLSLEEPSLYIEGEASSSSSSLLSTPKFTLTESDFPLTVTATSGCYRGSEPCKKVKRTFSSSNGRNIFGFL